MRISDIHWPQDPRAACELYLDFVIRVVERCGIAFPASRRDPVVVARGYLAGSVSEEDYRAEVTSWSDELMSTGGLRELRDPRALTIRLAMCVVGVTPERTPELGEYLDWFFQLLWLLGIDDRAAREEMERVFAPFTRTVVPPAEE
jgi:hypothetical protein